REANVMFEAAGTLGAGSPIGGAMDCGEVEVQTPGAGIDRQTPESAGTPRLEGDLLPPTAPFQRPNADLPGSHARSGRREMGGTNKKDGRPVLRSYLPSP